MSKANVIFIAMLSVMTTMGQSLPISFLNSIKNKHSVTFLKNAVVAGSHNDVFKINIQQRFETSTSRLKSKMLLKSSVSDTKQRLDSVVQQVWDKDANQFVNSHKDQYSFDNSGNTILYATYEWNSARKEWDGQEKFKYFYDYSSSNLIQKVICYWNSTTREWYDYSKEVYFYDSSNHKTKDVLYSYESSASQWEERDMSVYLYDSFGNMTIKYGYWKSSINTWIQDIKTEYTYDSKGNNVLIVDSILLNNTWSPNKKYEYTYDTNNRLISRTEYSGNRFTNQFEFYNKEEYTYDTNGQLKTETYYYWNSDSKSIEYGYKTDYTYDLNDNLSSMIRSSWNLSTKQWEVNFKSEVELDNTKLSKDVFSGDVFGDYSWVNVPLSANIYTPVGDNWIQSAKSTIYYSTHEISAGNSRVVPDVVCIYPNPALNYITLNIDKSETTCQFQLFDQQGEVVIDQQVGNNGQLSVEKLPRGFYIFKVSGKFKVFTGKLVLK